MTISQFENFEPAPVASPHVRFAAASPKRTTDRLLSTVRLAIAVRRPLDVAAYTALLNGIQGLRVVVADEDLAVCTDRCRKTDANAALFDATYFRLTAFKAAQTLLSHGVIRTVVFLDDQFAIIRAAKALEIRNSTYLTRQNDLALLLSEIGERLDSSLDFPGRAALPTGAPKCHFIQSLDELKRLDHAGFLSLTSRERQIVERMALGMSIKQMAEQLGVAVSTIDNHKTRLMKKLKLHKHSQIAMAALQAGLMDYP